MHTFIDRYSMTLTYMNLNQCKSTTTTKKSVTLSGFFKFIHFELRPECSRDRNVVPICFIAEKFPREVKCLGQGYREVKNRLFTIRKRWPQRTTLSFLKKSGFWDNCLRSYSWERLSGWLAVSAGSTLAWRWGNHGFCTALSVEDLLHLPSARWLCPSTKLSSANQTHSRCQQCVAW